MHGGTNAYIHARKKKRAVFLTALFTAGAATVGLFLVPYLDRHFKKVEIVYEEKMQGEKLLTAEDPDTAVVFFTRVGNTDFSENVDAVSSASLLVASGRLMGNAEFLSEMIHDISGAPVQMIRLTDYRYPSSYQDTVTIGGRELRERKRPAIAPVEVSEYQRIILVYPLWWGTIPMPVASFLESQDFTGKTIYLMATQGSSGFGSSAADVRKSAPGAEVIEGLSIYCDDVPDARERLYEWLTGLQ